MRMLVILAIISGPLVAKAGEVTKPLRYNSIARAAKLTCVKEGATMLGSPVSKTKEGLRASKEGLQASTWMSHREDPAIGTETVTLELNWTAEGNEILEIRYKSETGYVSKYQSNENVHLVYVPQSTVSILVFNGRMDIWSFQVNLETGLAFRTETLYAQAVSVGAYKCRGGR